MRRLIMRVQARADVARGNRRRGRSRTFAIEEMPGHPERVRHLPDPVEHETYWDTAVELLDGGLAEVCERTGWIR